MKKLLIMQNKIISLLRSLEQNKIR